MRNLQRLPHSPEPATKQTPLRPATSLMRSARKRAGSAAVRTALNDNG